MSARVLDLWRHPIKGCGVEAAARAGLAVEGTSAVGDPAALA